MVNTINEVNDMKEKIKRFFIEKKELLIFGCIVFLVFAAVITVAGMALGDDDTAPVANTNPSTVEPSVEPSANPTQNPSINTSKFKLPITGDYVVVRTFFDSALTDEELENAIISTGSYLITSNGVSYAKEDDSTFDVIAIYDGIVESVTEDELLGATVTIKHSNDVVSIYSSLENVTVSVGDTVTQGLKLADASTSINDAEAGVHVHLEIKINNEYVNPTSVYGKEIEEVASMK